MKVCYEEGDIHGAAFTKSSTHLHTYRMERHFKLQTSSRISHSLCPVIVFVNYKTLIFNGCQA